MHHRCRTLAHQHRAGLRTCWCSPRRGAARGAGNTTGRVAHVRRHRPPSAGDNAADGERAPARPSALRRDRVVEFRGLSCAFMPEIGLMKGVRSQPGARCSDSGGIRSLEGQALATGRLPARSRRWVDTQASPATGVPGGSSSRRETARCRGPISPHRRVNERGERATRVWLTRAAHRRARSGVWFAATQG